MNLKNFNLLIDKVVEEETSRANKRLHVNNTNLDENIIKTILNEVSENLFYLRLLPLFCKGEITTEEEFKFYKDFKIKDINLKINNVNSNRQDCSLHPECPLADFDTILYDLEQNKKYVENLNWEEVKRDWNRHIRIENDGQKINIPNVNCSIYGEIPKIQKFFFDDIRELDSKLQFIYNEQYRCDNCFRAFKIIESDNIFSKYLNIMKFHNELTHYQENGVHNFSFNNTRHLNFSEPFFSLYPGVSEKLFRQVCDNPRINEFCGEHVNMGFSKARSSNFRIANDAYNFYIASDLTVERVYNEYVNSYHPYRNAEKFLNYNESEFKYLADKYIGECKELDKLVNLLNEHSSFKVQSLDDLEKYQDCINPNNLNSIINLVESIEEFERKYNFSSSKLDNLNCTLESILNEIETVKEEFETLKKQLSVVQQELKQIRDNWEKLSRMDLLLFGYDDLKEYYTLVKDFICPREDDLIKIEKIAKFSFWNLSKPYMLGYEYCVLLIDLILSKCYDDVREFYIYHSVDRFDRSFYDQVEVCGRHEFIDYNQSVCFKDKVKFLDRNIKG